MQTLRLANEDQTTTIDLLRAPFGLRGGYDFQTPNLSGAFTVEPYGAQFSFGAFDRHVETFDLTIRGRGAMVLGALDTLQDFIESIRLFHAGDLAAKSCWLEWSAHGEEAKRTLLYSASFKASTMDNITPALEECMVIGTLSLTRHALWENIVELSVSRAEVPISSLGGQLSIVTVTGNTLARLSQFQIYTLDAAIGLDRHWVGLRLLNQGLTNFESLWECEDGTNGTDAADSVDATASGGDRVTVTYVTLTLVSRMTITVAQVCAAAGHTDYDHQQGRYLVLLRCKLSAAGTSGIQMRSGYTGNVISDEVYVDNTVWRLIPLGNISIPPWEGDRYGDDMFMYNFRIDIYAEQLTAGHNLYLDCLVLIPNEHMLTLDGCNTQVGTQEFVITHEDDTEVAYEYDAVNLRVSDAIESTMTSWYLPPGGVSFVFAAEDEATPDIADTVQVNISYYPRWLLYRGV